MPSSNLKEDARIAIIIECLNPGSLFKKGDHGQLVYEGLKGKTSAHIYGKTLSYDYVTKNYIKLRNAISESNSEESDKNIVKKISKSYILGGLSYYMIRDSSPNEQIAIAKKNTSPIETKSGPDLLGWIFLVVLTLGVLKCAGGSSSGGSNQQSKDEWVQGEMKKADDFCKRHKDFESCW